jgi:hypothetical protein
MVLLSQPTKEVYQAVIEHEKHWSGRFRQRAGDGNLDRQGHLMAFTMREAGSAWLLNWPCLGDTRDRQVVIQMHATAGAAGQGRLEGMDSSFLSPLSG